MQIAREVVDGLQPLATELDVSLTLTGENAPIFGIAQSLNLMIQNLCDNAIKYNRKGGSVNVDIQNHDDEILLTVSDTGIGIAPELQDRVFERFYRVDKGRSREMGWTTGIWRCFIRNRWRRNFTACNRKVAEGNKASSV